MVPKTLKISFLIRNMLAPELIKDPDFIRNILEKNYVRGDKLCSRRRGVKKMDITPPQAAHALHLLGKMGFLEDFNKNSYGKKYTVLHEPLNRYLEEIESGKC